MGIQNFAIICNLVHNMKYSEDGQGIMIMDIFGTIQDMVSECVMTLLVLMLANGWYTRFKNYDFEDGLETYAPLFLLVIMVHILFGALTYIDQDAYHKYHDYSGWVGYCLVGAKLTLVAVFFYFYSHTAPLIKKDSKHFYNQIIKIGLLYLLSDPLILLSSFFLEEYNRQFYFRLMDQSMHIFIQAYLFWQMRSKHSCFMESVHGLTSM